jgi:hypothetical protein
MKPITSVTLLAAGSACLWQVPRSASLRVGGPSRLGEGGESGGNARPCVRSGVYYRQRKRDSSRIHQSRQSCTIIINEDRGAACRLRSTRVLADEMFASGRLEKALAGSVDLSWPGCGVPGLDRARDQ